MKCVVLCAGKGVRLGGDKPKVLTLIHGRPLLTHVIDMWRESVDEFIFVVGYQWQDVVECLPPDSKHVFQEQQKGIADAILRTESLIDDKFIVALGDCIQKGIWDIKTGDFHNNT